MVYLGTEPGSNRAQLLIQRTQETGVDWNALTPAAQDAAQQATDYIIDLLYRLGNKGSRINLCSEYEDHFEVYVTVKNRLGDEHMHIVRVYKDGQISHSR